LLEKLVADYVFALLTESAVEGLAAENAARFAAMDAAHDNVSKKLEQLRQDARQARQDEITTELLDRVTGAEALHNPAVRFHKSQLGLPAVGTRGSFRIFRRLRPSASYICAGYWLAVFGIILGYCVLASLVKTWFVGRWGL
jgi:hypothetical protein